MIKDLNGELSFFILQFPNSHIYLAVIFLIEIVALILIAVLLIHIITWWKKRKLEKHGTHSNRKGSLASYADQNEALIESSTKKFLETNYEDVYATIN